MESQIEKYDEAFLKWIEEEFFPLIPDKTPQLLFAPPDRPYAERVSGHYVHVESLRMPRISLSRQDSEYDMSRQFPYYIRYMGYTSAAKTAIK